VPPDDDLNPQGDPPPTDDPPAGNEPPAPAGALPPEAIRNSPEYKELARQNRQLARQAGVATRAEQSARAAAERQKAAAEAQEQADFEAEIAATLGEDGVAAYSEIAELTASNPRAAARKLAELIAQARAQSPAPANGGEAPPAPGPEGGAPVPPAGTPPPPRGLGADAPLGQPPAAQDPTAQIVAELEKQYGDVVERVADPATRRRVTMRDRAGAFISYLGASYLKSGARPSNKT
jgi:hypothetical protein